MAGTGTQSWNFRLVYSSSRPSVIHASTPKYLYIYEVCTAYRCVEVEAQQRSHTNASF